MMPHPFSGSVERKTMNDFYVYAHRKQTSGEIFYIGKGRGTRAYSTKRTDFWRKVSTKYGFIVDFIAANLSEEDAFELEEFLILEIGRIDLGSGPLINMTAGGEGCSGRVVSEKVREGARERLKKMWEDDRVTMLDLCIKGYPSEKRSKDSKKRWGDPEFKKMMANKMSDSLVNSEARSTAMKALWENEDYRRKQTEMAFERWKDPEYAKSVSEGMKNALTDEVRKKLSDSNKGRWNDETRSAHGELLKEVFAEMSKVEGWSEAVSEARSKGVSRYYENNPEAKLKAAEVQREKWKDPEFRAKRGKAISDGWARRNAIKAAERGKD
jgi:hypothetical protein